MIRFENWPQWFQQMWPGERQRRAVLAAYVAVARDHPNVLADIAMQCGVFAPALDIRSEFDAGVAEGERRAALRIFKLARMNMDELFKQTQLNGAKQ